MPVQFSHAVGYRGLCRLGAGEEGQQITKENSSTILCTGGSINLTQDPIMSSGVWGAGYINTAPIAYAWNYLSLEGNASFELTSDGATGTMSPWEILKKRCITEKTKKAPVQLLPDGHNGFDGAGWCNSLSFEASEGAAVTGSFNFRGDPSSKRNNGDGPAIVAEGTDEMDRKLDAGGEYEDEGKWGLGVTQFGLETSEDTPLAEEKWHPLAGSKLIPYWATSLAFTNASGQAETFKDVISWSCNYNSDLQPLKCCNIDRSSPIRPDYMLIGEATADGNFTIFRINGDFSPSGYHKLRTLLKFGMNFGQVSTNLVGDNGWYTPVGGSQPEYGGVEVAKDIRALVIPQAIVSSGSTSMTTGASYVSVEYSFTGIGNGVNPIMTMQSGLDYDDFESASSNP